ncbi:hypothetical protein HZS_3005 [Henneguya salminicola]|nr:hypothetical protein HZS_3005 [Henneguya salminicola]
MLPAASGRPLKICIQKNNMEVLFEWAAKNGAEISKVKVDSTEMNFFLVAAENIEPHSSIVTIPKKLMISATDFTKREKLNKLIGDGPILFCSDKILLTYGLLTEFYSGHESEYWPYLQSLPKTYTNLCYFDVEEMLMLKGLASFRETLIYWKNIVRQYAHFHLNIIINSNKDKNEAAKFINKLNLIDRFCYEDYRWAAAVVMSRSFSVPTNTGCDFTAAMIPIVDLCNHSNTKPISAIILNMFEHTMQVSCDLEIKTGKQVCISYNVISNCKFVYRYGFFDENNMLDCLMLKLPFIKDNHLYSLKKQLFIKYGLFKYESISIGVFSSNPWSGNIVPHMRIYVANEEDLSRIRLIPEKDFLSRIYETTPISQKNETSAKNTLINILSDQIRIYESALQSPKNIYHDKNVSNETNHIINFKRCELKLCTLLLSKLTSEDLTQIKSEQNEL